MKLNGTIANITEILEKINKGSTLIFVVDNTGSMRPIINEVKKIAKDIVDIADKLNFTMNYMLGTFNDPSKLRNVAV